jgi:P27 family predicted phage terminase small subunit
MRGRSPKPAGLKEAQGNPGKRRSGKFADLAPTGEPSAFMFDVSADAKVVYDRFGPELRRLNILRSSDEPAFWRYCETLSRFCRLGEVIRKFGAEYYVAKSVTGEKMMRLHPAFIAQERYVRRLESLEDRFGLTPMARQQYMLALSRGQVAPPDELPLNKPPQPAPEANEIPVTGAIH